MKITKFGHCCLLIEEGELRLLTDPGNYGDLPDVQGVDVILITHEHGDHAHIPYIKEILRKNPECEIITHISVGKMLEAEKIPYTPIADNEAIQRKGVSIASYGTLHACVHKDIPAIQNTGFMIAGRLFYPGDSFHDPHKEIEILALPVAGPWMKLEEAIEYAKAIKPKVVFPVHDGMLRQDHRLGPTRRAPQAILEPLGIAYKDMTEGSVVEL